MLRTHAQLPSPFMMRERSLSIQSGWSAPTVGAPGPPQFSRSEALPVRRTPTHRSLLAANAQACDPSAAEVAEMLFSLRSGKRSAAELEEEVPAQPEERSSSSTGSGKIISHSAGGNCSDTCWTNPPMTIPEIRFPTPPQLALPRPRQHPSR